jgi:hypothetical protein
VGRYADSRPRRLASCSCHSGRQSRRPRRTQRRSASSSCLSSLRFTLFQSARRRIHRPCRQQRSLDFSAMIASPQTEGGLTRSPMRQVAPDSCHSLCRRVHVVQCAQWFWKSFAQNSVIPAPDHACPVTPGDGRLECFSNIAKRAHIVCRHLEIEEAHRARPFSKVFLGFTPQAMPFRPGPEAMKTVSRRQNRNNRVAESGSTFTVPGLW